MLLDQLKPNIIVRGPIFPEPVQVIVAIPMGTSVKLVGKGLNTNQVHEPILNAEQLAQLESTPEKEPFDGDPLRFRIGVEAFRLGLAYEYDPYFSLSIARVDPLPHQLEAVYDYFLTMPRIRFLLADDPGAGKTIMAGLLLKELKIRGLGQADADHHASQPVIPVATGNEREVPRAVRGHSQRRASSQLRHESVARTESGGHVPFVGLSDRGCQGQPPP